MRSNSLTITILLVAILLGMYMAFTAGYNVGSRDTDTFWQINHMDTVQRYRDTIDMYQKKIDQLQAEGINFQIAIQDLKNEKRNITRHYEKVIAGIDTLSVSELQRYFAIRYGGGIDSTSSQGSGQGFKLVGLP